jgi:hypothetical protein
VSSCIFLIFTVWFQSLAFIFLINTSPHFAKITMSHKALYYFKALSMINLRHARHALCINYIDLSGRVSPGWNNSDGVMV